MLGFFEEAMSKLTIIMYHYVRDLAHSAYPAIKGLDLALFEEQLDFLAREFTPVRMEDVLEALTIHSEDASLCHSEDASPCHSEDASPCHSEEPFCCHSERQRRILPDNALLLTFDDGYIDHYENVYPALKKRGIQGSFFIPGKTFTEHALLDVNKIHFILAASSTAQLKADLFAELDELRSLKDIRRPEDADHATAGGSASASASISSLPSGEELYARYGKARMFDDADTVFCKSLLQSVLSEDVRGEIASKLFARYVGEDEGSFARKLYMNKEQMLEMKAEGMFFVLHGYDHYWMNALTPEELKADMEKALAATAELIDEDQRVINYPYGRVSDSVVDYMKSIGCKAGVTIERGCVQLPFDKPDDVFLLPRFDCNDFPPKSEVWREYM